VPHLAFEGLGARQADTEAFVDNRASNAVSQAMGYLPNGVGWATRRGEAAELNRWRPTRGGAGGLRRFIAEHEYAGGGRGAVDEP
jgi:RimJ/RimL family protein N-acetyltransferase